MKQQILDIINNNSSSNGDFGTVIQDCDLDKIATEISNQLERVVNAIFTKDEWDYIGVMLMSWQQGINPDAIDHKNLPKYIEKCSQLSKNSL